MNTLENQFHFAYLYYNDFLINFGPNEAYIDASALSHMTFSDKLT